MLTLTKDRALSLALLVIVAAMWVESGSIRPPTSWQPYGSALFPRILLVTIAVLSLLVLVRSFMVSQRVASPFMSRAKCWLNERKIILALFALFGFYAALLPVVGYIMATAGFLIVSQALLLGIDTRRKWVINLSISVVLVALLYVIFRYGLNVWLP
ncbi:tripartite tricarboxylate transporter TctB family protein [Halomonas sp. PAMB 3232]|uniref:tripartite tricarboxylate transporter TctB family protein n=1 Tax=Halomonas sp. PAMB 3232 TaxID=3075221 RepID=UPI00289CEBD7|nr:tripartite tricarboxylate transporter TctB family protein [Halomonas sp. PAMB 3232]WNL38150.1 tripartite tricarboxylate transporter TctB family protein [Halomonas sp. PAMB 3232]